MEKQKQKTKKVCNLRTTHSSVRNLLYQQLQLLIRLGFTRKKEAIARAKILDILLPVFVVLVSSFGKVSDYESFSIDCIHCSRSNPTRS